MAYLYKTDLKTGLGGLNMEQMIINLVTGAVGGNVAGFILKKFDMGMILNTVMGVVGGGIGGQLLGGLVDGGTVGNIASSAVGGGGLMVVVGLIKNMLSK
jgi:uncharacterized membrane protein YeaQ/YmgE (transglycosylase-associated protein family)